MNLTHLVVAADEVWTPDLLPFNPLKPAVPLSQLAPYCILVKASGEVIHVPVMEHTFRCAKLADGTHKCKLKFGPWTHSADEIALQVKNGTSVTFETVDNPHWEVASESMVKQR